MAEGFTPNPLSPQNIRALSIPRRGVEQRRLAGLIPRRSWVRVPPPLPTASAAGSWRPQTLQLPASAGELGSWWLERGGTTRSHPEHGSETPQRPRYCPGDWVWKIGRCQELFFIPETR